MKPFNAKGSHLYRKNVKDSYREQKRRLEIMSKIIEFNNTAKETNLFEVEECKSFIVKTGYENIPELVKAYEKYGIEFPDVEFIINCRREDGKYMLDFYIGFENYGNRYFDVGLPVDINEEKLKEYILNMIESNFDNTYWGEMLKDYFEEFGIEYEEDSVCLECECRESQDVFQDWLNNRDDLEEILEDIEGDVKGMSLGIGYLENEECVGTIFYIQTDDDMIQVEGYHINPEDDAIEKRAIAEKNYEIYLNLLKRLFGLEPFKDFGNIIPYEKYMEMIQEHINMNLSIFNEQGMCTDEVHYQIERCIRIAAEENMQLKVLNKGCEACPNKACKLHP